MIHDLMLKCWHKDRTKRPKFKEIVEQIEQWIKTPLLLREVASVVRKRYVVIGLFKKMENLTPILKKHSLERVFRGFGGGFSGFGSYFGVLEPSWRVFGTILAT